MKKTMIAISLFFLAGPAAFSQEDVKGSKDHALLSRYEGAWIIRYEEKEFETMEYPLSADKEGYGKLANTQRVEGHITSIEYNLPEGVTATQVFRSYETQLKKAGLTIPFRCEKSECGDLPLYFTRNYLPNSSSQLGNAMVGKTGSYLFAKGQSSGEEYLVTLVVGESSREKHARYRMDIIKVEKLDTDKVSVADMASTIEREGKIALYGINFDFNSATLQETSTGALQLISDYLQENPSLQVLIVGHTDNVGTYEQNLQLSQKRAEAVVDQLVSKYAINKDRLMPIGVSTASPVATNATEEGRALNRRVEVVLR